MQSDYTHTQLLGEVSLQEFRFCSTSVGLLNCFELKEHPGDKRLDLKNLQIPKVLRFFIILFSLS